MYEMNTGAPKGAKYKRQSQYLDNMLILRYLATTKPKQLVKICTKYANNRPEITYIMKNGYPKLQEKIEDHETLLTRTGQ